MTMSTPNNIEDRLTDLEVKLSFTEDLVDTLNDTIAKQQRQLELITRELVQLRNMLPSDDVGRQRSLRDEIPPHY
jgi:SlyX protein